MKIPKKNILNCQKKPLKNAEMIILRSHYHSIVGDGFSYLVIFSSHTRLTDRFENGANPETEGRSLREKILFSGGVNDRVCK